MPLPEKRTAIFSKDLVLNQPDLNLEASSLYSNSTSSSASDRNANIGVPSLYARLLDKSQQGKIKKLST
ncbi:UNVERIFIED_CONTAM: hypothetical protein NY100_25865, partial [Prevotella sp. 15_C9]